ncbi:MAG: hypothetical protein HN642_02415, partial [Methylococcales bacterium]|nr:hypothetical protein [Methylococcales bacterium]
MKKIILILISLLFLAGCMEKEVSELQARAGVKYEIKSEIPFTGKLIKRYENGLKKLEEHYDNGKLSGLSTEWYLNKRKKTVRHY